MYKIAVTGPESTGKSALCEALAKHFNTCWVPEFARTYLAGRTPPYAKEDLDLIATGQLNAEKEMLSKANNILFCDTDMTVMKVWSEHAFGSCSPLIEKLYREQSYDAYLLCDIDLPWEPDPLREHPDLRSYFFDTYHTLLKPHQNKLIIISGSGKSRVENAIHALRILGIK